MEYQGMQPQASQLSQGGPKFWTAVQFHGMYQVSCADRNGMASLWQTEAFTALLPQSFSMDQVSILLDCLRMFDLKSLSLSHWLKFH